MDFAFSEEQQLLLNSTRRYLQSAYGFERRRTIARSAPGWSAAVWKDFAELGLLALTVPERDGGLGGSAIESLLVGQALGEHLVVEPWLQSAVLATQAIANLGSAAQRSTWLPRLADGSLIGALVAQPDANGVIATQTGNSWQLQGRVPVTYHAPAARLLLVAARTPAATQAIFALPENTPGLRLNAYVTVDDQTCADVVLEDVKSDAAACLATDAAAQVSELLDLGTVALCAEALGALERCLALTVEYTRNRSQFGGPIARFQVLQHRMAEMLMSIEQARSLVYLAATRCNERDATAREVAASAAKVLIGAAAQRVGEQAVQLHGAMGLTDECATSHYFKRLLATRFRLGSEAFHLERYAHELAASAA